MYLVLIETSGNQNFIFSTNKLRENIGASELTYRACTRWVLEAVAQVNNSRGISLWTTDGRQLGRNLFNKQLNQQIESANNRVEVIIATSGKALLIAKDEETAKTLIRYVTKKAVIEAPGLEICGVFQEFNWEEDLIGKVNSEVHQKYELVRSQKPSNNLRFTRLPVITDCATSGLPAGELFPNPEPNEKPISTSAVSAAKQRCSEGASNRMIALLEGGDRFSEDIDDIKSDWIAIIHADGNGLGEIFLKFHEHISADRPNKNRDYIDKLRKFSLCLDICTERAFNTALDQIKPFIEINNNLIPLVPLVLGGDDLTVVCDGKFALKFTQEFLKAFEQETASITHYEGIIPEIAKTALKVGRLSACAGIAIIKPHFPFSVGYDLSEALMKSAKKIKKIVVNDAEKPYPCSSLDFHVLYDSSNVNFEKIRGKLHLDGGKTQLYVRPYVVTEINNLSNAKQGLEWANFHHWQKLENSVKVLVDKDLEGRRKLPNSQMHDLRESLFLGKNAADGKFQLICDRYHDNGISQLAGDENSLFSLEPDLGIYKTILLDAIEAADFLIV
ncbi:hypothetical protein Cri9333_0579 [Crinalium epipsammum PCC 9333]|uniref:Cas10/Cmr2 second palm domain-containing protein n=1 Tax=Crinalium epipsammum PCC 9333 TaxID=1173022 RepID=K9VWK7_9CYAN|nr:hypothetical protein [Crinalium epipsammum]AFZ11525.1 hypothetical protein Cri9333_0579 [Crinalium epipsammum PCC 9333]